MYNNMNKNFINFKNMQEIERKFLVKGDFRPFVSKSTRIVQGYLSSIPERTVRVRIKGDKGFLTIKGIGNESGASRFEFEKEITVTEASELLNICEPGVIDKVRHLVKVEPYVFEVDEFHGENEGLIVAEIELPDENAAFSKPEWTGEEVTGDKRYYNSMLMKTPFSKWQK
jgi:adenylate cyclase